MGIGQNVANFGATSKNNNYSAVAVQKNTQWCINIFQKASFIEDLVGEDCEDPGTLGTLGTLQPVNGLVILPDGNRF